MNNFIKTKPMKENLYRESRVAKVLGDPAKYSIVELLLHHGPTSVSEIVKKVSRSQPTVSNHLARLKSLEVVRFETKPDGVYYWIKYEKEIRAIVNSLSRFVNRSLQGVHYET